MIEEMVINKRISGGMLGDRKRETAGYTSVTNGTALSSPMGRFNPASIIILTYAGHVCATPKVFH